MHIGMSLIKEHKETIENKNIVERLNIEECTE